MYFECICRKAWANLACHRMGNFPAGVRPWFPCTLFVKYKCMIAFLQSASLSPELEYDYASIQ